jgi:hypothetical protein
MADREKVIKGLEICVDRVPGKYTCNECPYEIDGNYCETNLAKDAIALLKEQEAVEPKKTAYQRVDHTIACRYRCGTCDMSIFPSYKYCPFCGQAVKWDG